MGTRLACLPGLHLAANDHGGLSVRDRIACGQAIASRIAGRLGDRTEQRRLERAA